MTRAQVVVMPAHVPRYQQRMMAVPGNLGRPEWYDDPEFDLDDFVTRTLAEDLGEGGDVTSAATIPAP